MRDVTALVFLLSCAAAADGASQSPAPRPAAAPAPPIAVIPRPVKVTPRTGHFTLTARTVISTDVGSAALGRQLARYLEPATGYVLAVRRGAATGSRIVLRQDATLKRLGSEGYLLEVRPGAVTVRAITSGLAPGYSVCTWMVGKSTCGSADSGRNL